MVDIKFFFILAFIHISTCVKSLVSWWNITSISFTDEELWLKNIVLEPYLLPALYKVVSVFNALNT